jgi:hypothetical protein
MKTVICNTCAVTARVVLLPGGRAKYSSVVNDYLANCHFLKEPHRGYFDATKEPCPYMEKSIAAAAGSGQ